MTSTLPLSANLEQLKNQAKDLLKAHQSGNPESCHALRILHRFDKASDQEILDAALKLSECQFALAMDYGFKNWAELKSHVAMAAPAAVGDVEDRLIESNGLKPHADAPALKVAVRILASAVADNVSDFHFQPRLDVVSIRFRLDGILREVEALPKQEGEVVTREIISMGRMDTAEVRRPQDGKVTMNIDGRKIDFRISVVPGVRGQVLAIRVLDQARMIQSIAGLGFEPGQLERYQTLIRSSNGLIIVTGPTGGGKTTTLYATLNELNQPDEKIITVEDPVEYIIEGIDQIPLPKGLTFANTLRAMLRQAANVILVGELRDPETANLVFPAALTGHLVFSTLHTESAPHALMRLMDMGVAPFMIADSLKCVVGQRVIRRICPDCKAPYKPSDEEIRSFGLNEVASAPAFFKGKGCDKCRQTGYRGRVGVFSILDMTEDVKRALHTGDLNAIITAAKKSGWCHLRDVGFLKAARGETSLEEVLTLP